MIVDGRRVLRVFPRRTDYTPRGPYAVVGEPPAGLPKDIAEVHISCLFTWDLEECWRLEELYRALGITKEIFLGGPAVRGFPGAFRPGLYVAREFRKRDGQRYQVTFTSRGCSENCPWCLVPEYEGGLRPLADVEPGNIIQDNNFLACPKEHRRKVYRMLRSQSTVRFAGGLDARHLTAWDVEELEQLSIRELYFAADCGDRLRHLEKAAYHLREFGAHLTPDGRRRKLRCYVLCGFDGGSVDAARNRLERVWELGFLPFAQLYQPPGGFVNYDRGWKALQKQWCRPAIMFAQHKGKG